MNRVTFRFYAELNDLLPASRRRRGFTIALPHRNSVKDAVESSGVPHTEVALLLVNNRPADWKLHLGDGDRVAVYPAGTVLDFSRDSLVWTPLPDPLKFILDVHLGKLARYLRMLGFDTAYFNHDITDPELVRIAVEESRILLTMDRKLLMYNGLKWGSVIRERKPRHQVPEVLDRYRCRSQVAPFTRCMMCNTRLREQSPEKHIERLPPAVASRYRESGKSLYECPGCGRIYWPGSHWDRMRKMMSTWEL